MTQYIYGGRGYSCYNLMQFVFFYHLFFAPPGFKPRTSSAVSESAHYCDVNRCHRYAHAYINRSGSRAPHLDHNSLSPQITTHSPGKTSEPHQSPGHSPPPGAHLTHTACTHTLGQNQICSPFQCPSVVYIMEENSC